MRRHPGVKKIQAKLPHTVQLFNFLNNIVMFQQTGILSSAAETPEAGLLYEGKFD